MNISPKMNMEKFWTGMYRPGISSSCKVVRINSSTSNNLFDFCCFAVIIHETPVQFGRKLPSFLKPFFCFAQSAITLRSHMKTAFTSKCSSTPSALNAMWNELRSCFNNFRVDGYRMRFQASLSIGWRVPEKSLSRLKRSSTIQHCSWGACVELRRHECLRPWHMSKYEGNDWSTHQKPREVVLDPSVWFLFFMYLLLDAQCRMLPLNVAKFSRVAKFDPVTASGSLTSQITKVY